MITNRRDWLRQSALAALGLSIPFSTFAQDVEGLPVLSGSEPVLVNLGSNENPYGISAKARQAIVDMMGSSHRYQFNVGSLKNFQKELAAYYGMGEENILVSAGSGEALGLAARYFNKGNIVTAKTTFPVLPNTARRLGTGVNEIPLTEDKIHDLPAMLSAINEQTGLIYLVNPANPTATVLKPADLKAFCLEASKKAVVLVDEAYIDFPDAPYNESMMQLVTDNPNILVMRTFSKIHAMAGLRIGFTMGHPSLIKKLYETYFSSTNMCLSNLSMAAALASLKDEKHRQTCREKNAAARDFTLNALRQMGYKAYPSYTNFMFFSLGNYPGNFAEDMLKKGILLRSGSFGQPGNWCRVSIGTMPEMEEFIRVMKTMG